MTKLRILHLANEAAMVGNGIVNVMVDLACIQADEGHEVAIASSGGSYEELLRRHRVDHLQLVQRTRVSKLPVTLAAFNRIVERFKPDIVHAHMMSGAVIAKLGSLRHNYKLVTTVHNEFQKTSVLMGVGDAVVAVSEAVAESMVRRGIAARRMHVVLNGIVGAPRLAGRTASTGPVLFHPCIVTVSGLYERKGVGDLIRAYAVIKAKVCDAHLYIVGDGPDREIMVKLAHELGVHESTHFMGYIADPSPYFSQADVFALPSHSEACPLVLMEARQAGCAIVATSVGGIPEILKYGEAGSMVPPSDPASLANAIVPPLTNEGVRRDWQRRARTDLGQLSAKRMYEEYLTIYARLAGKDERTARVLFVDQSGQLGGAEFALLPLAGAYKDRGAVALLSEGPFRTRLQEIGIEVSLVSDPRVSKIDRQTLRFGWFASVPAIARQVFALARAAKSFDVLFLNTQKSLVLGALGKALHRKPVVWYLHDIMTPAHFGGAQLKLVKWLARHAVDRVVANSRASAKALIDLTGLPATDVAVVHNGIDMQAFQRVRAHDVASLRLQFGLPEAAWTVGLFGRLAPWKGQHIAIEAIARLPDVHLALVGAALYGEEDYVGRLHEQVRRLNVTDRVHFMGFRDDVPAHMRAMDLILHASTEPEPLGRVVIEGMAAQRPVLATAAGGVLEIIRNRENGWLVRPNDVEEMAQALDFLRSKPRLLQRLAEQGAVDAERHFSVQAYLEKMALVIEDAASNAVPLIRTTAKAARSEETKPRTAIASRDQDAPRPAVEPLDKSLASRDVAARLDDVS